MLFDRGHFRIAPSGAGVKLIAYPWRALNFGIDNGGYLANDLIMLTSQVGSSYLHHLAAVEKSFLYLVLLKFFV